MNRNLLESQWTQIRETLREKFPNLSEDDIRQINGQYDQLVAKLQQKYGYTREEAEDKIRNWNFDRLATPRSYTVHEEKIESERNDFSPYKWLLGLGIPLLLLGAYFLSTRTPEMTNTPRVAQEQVIQETPADRSISSGLRSSLMGQQQGNLADAMRNIQVTTNGGVVTLSGSVPNATMRDRIVSQAQDYPGVRRVVNHIVVK